MLALPKTKDPKELRSDSAAFLRHAQLATQDSDAATQQRDRPMIAAAQPPLLGASHKHDLMVAYAAANHRADNATNAPTMRDADALMHPIEAGQPAQYRHIVSGGA